jgi:hypothetical protein
VLPDKALWPAIASAGAAWLALFLSLLNLHTSRRAIRLAERQDQRRQPQLVPYLQKAQLHFTPNKDRVYAFSLSVSNRSDTGNAIAEAELRLTYGIPAGNEVTIKVRANAACGKAFEAMAGPPLSIPAEIGAHQTVHGWCYFGVSAALLENAKVQRQTLALIDSHGIAAIVEPVVVAKHGLFDKTP